MPKIFDKIFSEKNPFSTRAVLKGQPKDICDEIYRIIERRNYTIMLPTAAGVFLITAIFIFSDSQTHLWQEQYPVSMFNLSAEIIHTVASIMFFLSHLDKKVRSGSLKRKHMYSSLFIVLFTLGCTCYCLGDTIRGRDPGSHYFILMVLCILPILSSAEFLIYYICLYAAPALVLSIVLSTFDVLYVGIYLSAIMLHWILRANFVKGELHRLKYEQVNAELESLSMTDPLTRVGNRQLLYKFLSERAPEWAKNQETVCLVMTDIDKFKNYNDTYSHLKGDECLVSIASVISGVLKETENTENLFIRFGGEEFMFILAGSKAEEVLLSIYPKIRKRIAELELKSGKGAEMPFVTVSMGAHIFKYSPSAVFEEELKEADKRLYHVKENGRDGMCYNNKIYRDPA